MPDVLKKALVIVPTVLVVGGLAYRFVLLPWHLRWGATEDEVRAAMPGG